MIVRLFNNFYRYCIFSLIALLFSGCSSFRGPIYPDIIYNNRQPLISVTYEYGEIELKLPLRYDAAVPDNILFKVYAQGDTTYPIISILQESPKEFLAYLPQGVLDIQNNTNLIKIIPQDKNFGPLNVRFRGVRFGRIQLPPKTIRMQQLVILGNVFLNNNDSALAGVHVSLQSYDNVIYETKSNESGLFKMAIPGEYKFAKYLRLVAGENVIFKPFKQKLDFSNTFKIKLDIGLGPSVTMPEPLYMTNKQNVHFREGPDIGSETLFLLEEGEVISVTRVTPGEYHGVIEIALENKENVQMEGWVNRSDLRLVNFYSLFK